VKRQRFLFLIAFALGLGPWMAVADPGDRPENRTRTAARSYDTIGLDSLRLTGPGKERLPDLPSIVVLQPRDFAEFRSGFDRGLQRDSSASYRFPGSFGFRWPSFGGDEDLSESRLAAVVQDELTQALTASRSFNVLVPATGAMGGDLGNLEAEMQIGRGRREEPLDDEPTAEFVFGSGLGVKAVERRDSTISGGTVVEAVEGILGDRLSWNDRWRLDKLREIQIDRSEVVVTVVVNGYVAQGRTIRASGHGIGVSHFRRRQDVNVLGSGGSTARTDAYVFDAVRTAVQDLLDNLVPPGGAR
jgi:hypothetical protein